MKTFKNIFDFQKEFSTEEKCREYLEQQRWNGTPDLHMSIRCIKLYDVNTNVYNLLVHTNKKSPVETRLGYSTKTIVMRTQT